MIIGQIWVKKRIISLAMWVGVKHRRPVIRNNLGNNLTDSCDIRTDSIFKKVQALVNYKFCSLD